MCLSVVLVACKKEHTTPAPKVNTEVVLITVDQNQPGYPISPIFEGLSFETAILSRNPEYLNVNNSAFIQLIKNLGPGLLRIGGDTSDEIDWTGKTRAISTSIDSLTTSDIDRLSAFSKATGWPVMFGLNLGSNHIAAAANEALYVYSSLGTNLYALQAGNEPDIYHMYGLRSPSYEVYEYNIEWDNYISTIKTKVPQVCFTGPDIATRSYWIPPFADNENKKLKMIDAHYYLTGPASNPSISYKTLLEPFHSPDYFQLLNNQSSKYGLPYRITESNNIYGGGKAGASDVFAATLWALDLMWIIAENNGQGINFHDGKGLFYSPITMENGVALAKPEYYAMLAFKYGNNGGKIIPVTITNTNYNITAYASANADNTYSVTLINKEESKNIDFNIQLNKAASTAQIARLTAPSLTAANHITFAGSTVNTDGTFVPGALQNRAITKSSIIINIPAGSAAVITIH